MRHGVGGREYATHHEYRMGENARWMPGQVTQCDSSTINVSLVRNRKYTLHQTALWRVQNMYAVAHAPRILQPAASTEDVDLPGSPLANRIRLISASSLRRSSPSGELHIDLSWAYCLR